ncbi:MAG: hypothetical protein A2X66_06505 [Ignavibacteria bacterium GWA2_54_16]|nr:MAG: hypothetical protein A2X66_06505 [Ignavibacteria bacterium GWA2_54_16]
MGGGQGFYGGFSIPSKMLTNENATYDCGGTVAASATTFVFTATSAQNTTNKITVTIDAEGRLTGWSYAGDFQ